MMRTLGRNARFGSQWLAWGAVGAALVVGLPSRAVAAVIPVADGTFLDANWTLTQSFPGNGGTVTASQDSQVGNFFRRVVNSVNSMNRLLGVHIFNAFTYDPAASGAITSLDYAEDAACFGGSPSGCFGDGQATGAALKQGTSFYVVDSFVAIFTSADFHPITMTGLTAADFALVDMTEGGYFDNTQHPDFSAAGAPIQFGFLRANSSPNVAYSIDAGIDNWQVVIHSSGVAAEVPTLGAVGFVVLATVLGLLGTAILRRVV